MVMPIDGLVVGAAFLSGLLGGAHCAAMCGGIATGFATQQNGGWWTAAQPNLGRIAGYALAGAIVGGFGSALLDIARWPGLTLFVRASVGVVLILVALRLLDRRGRLGFLAVPGNRFWQFLRPLQSRLLPANTATRRIGLGLLWGWMPCGLQTTLLAAAWLQASALHGATTMIAFGLGTLPVMLPLTWAGMRVGQRLQRGGWRTASGWVVLGSGLLTLTAPWLMHSPAIHGVLATLGCRSLAT